MIEATKATWAAKEAELRAAEAEQRAERAEARADKAEATLDEALTGLEALGWPCRLVELPKLYAAESAKLDRVRELLSANGCECEDDPEWSDGSVCLPCRIAEVLGKEGTGC